jgi:multiple sugar transport system permease protein
MRKMSGLSRQGFKLLIPVYICILVFSLYPLLRGIYIGFTDYSLGSGMKFNGIKNYIDIFESLYFAVSFKNIAFIVIMSLAAIYALGLALSLILNSNIRFKWLWQSILIIPWAVPPICKVGIWRVFFNSLYGYVNFALSKLGIIHNYMGWTDNPDQAIYTIITVITWGCIPFLTLTLLAALKSIPTEIYDASKLDGSSPLQEFRYITMPYLSKATMVTTSLLFVWVINDFTSLYVITGGGPGDSTLTPLVEAYKHGFAFGKFGKAAAYGNLLILAMSFFLYMYIKNVFQRGSSAEEKL